MSTSTGSAVFTAMGCTTRQVSKPFPIATENSKSNSCSNCALFWSKDAIGSDHESSMISFKELAVSMGKRSSSISSGIEWALHPGGLFGEV